MLAGLWNDNVDVCVDTERAGDDSRESGEEERSSLCTDDRIEVSRSFEGILDCEFVCDSGNTYA